MVGDFVTNQDHRRVIVFVDDGDSQRLKQRIDLRFFPSDERPTRLDFEFFRAILSHLKLIVTILVIVA